MEMREPIGTLYNCNFLDDAKSPTFWIHSPKPKDPQKNILPLLCKKISNLLDTAGQLHQMLKKLNHLCLQHKALQARDNNDPNKGSEYEIRETHGRLPLLLGEKF